MNKPLPASLTSYDFLKIAALLLMVVDHVGHYFYPDDMVFRAIGRLSAPIWLFLVGYAQSRDLSPRMWIGIAVMIVSAYAVGAALLPLSILVTIVVARLAIDPLMALLRRAPGMLYPVGIGLIFLTVFAFPFAVGDVLPFGFGTFVLFEYGTGIFVWTMLGYMVRNAESLPYSTETRQQFGIVMAVFYAVLQSVIFFSLSTPLLMFVVAGCIAVALLLLKFRPYEYPGLTNTLPRPLAGLMRLMGRRTLEFYVIHIVLFRFAALYFETLPYELFTFHIVD